MILKYEYLSEADVDPYTPRNEDAWMYNDKRDEISTEASTLSALGVACVCGETVRTKNLTVKVNREAEITHWVGRCPSCGIKQVIFND